MKNFIIFILGHLGLTHKPFKYETFYDWQPCADPPYNQIETCILEYAEAAFNAGREKEAS